MASAIARVVSGDSLSFDVENNDSGWNCLWIERVVWDFGGN